MVPQTVFCHNPACPARGQIGKGNIGVHSRGERRYICHECRTTFSEGNGTPFYRLRTSKDLVVIVTTLLANGCPIQAIVIAFGLDERTVVNWQERSGAHCLQVHRHLVEQLRESLDGRRVALIPSAIATLDSAKEARPAFQGDHSPRCPMVLMTTVKCGAIRPWPASLRSPASM